jgi:hypothetical protein
LDSLWFPAMLRFFVYHVLSMVLHFHQAHLSQIDD